MNPWAWLSSDTDHVGIALVVLAFTLSFVCVLAEAKRSAPADEDTPL